MDFLGSYRYIWSRGNVVDFVEDNSKNYKKHINMIPMHQE